MATNLKRKRDGETESAAALAAETREKTIDLAALKEEWTPDRIARIQNGVMKVSSKHEPGFCIEVTGLPTKTASE